MDLSFFLLAFSSLFTLVDSVGYAPIFVAYTDRFKQADVARIARKASLAAALLLLLLPLPLAPAQ